MGTPCAPSRTSAGGTILAQSHACQDTIQHHGSLSRSQPAQSHTLAGYSQHNHKIFRRRGVTTTHMLDLVRAVVVHVHPGTRAVGYCHDAVLLLDLRSSHSAAMQRSGQRLTQIFARNGVQVFFSTHKLCVRQIPYHVLIPSGLLK
eukprot:g82612.t1